MADFSIKKGFDINLAGPPERVIDSANAPALVSVFPQHLGKFVPRALVKEGDPVKRGTPLFYSKQDERLKFCSPAAGTVKAVVLGARRALTEIVIEVAAKDEAESVPATAPDQITGHAREEVLELLLGSGHLAYLRQRPFGGIADPEITPKSIFVNGMSTGPFQPDLHVAVQGDEEAFQAGLDLLTCLTDGKVHLCLAADAPAPSPAVTDARNVELHTFRGPHPAGNTSVHIHHIDPVTPGDHVWAIKGIDLIQIGRLVLTGEVPGDRVVSLAGSGIREGERKYIRTAIGTPLAALLEGRQEEGDLRILSGDALSGEALPIEGGVRFLDSGYTVLPVGRERRFMGWMAPGLNRYSRSPSFLSRWLKRRATWTLDTNLNGGKRAMVLTGLYDRYVPMKIMVDYLVRAVLAHDTTEAVNLGLLETVPEDFALCTFACPSKTDLGGIIQKGLEEVEAEGL